MKSPTNQTATGTDLEDVAHQLVALKHKGQKRIDRKITKEPETEAWMLRAEDAAENAHYCRDIIEEFARKHSQEYRNIIRSAAQVVAEAYIDSGTTEDLSKQSDRHPNSRPFLNDRYRAELFAVLRTHAGLRLAGRDSQRDSAPVPFDLANISAEEASAPEVISEVQKWKDAAAIVLLLAGDKDFEILLARFGLRWKEKGHLTRYAQSSILARAEVGAKRASLDSLTAEALFKLGVNPERKSDETQARRRKRMMGKSK
jgi:hypothetical protein